MTDWPTSGLFTGFWRRDWCEKSTSNAAWGVWTYYGVKWLPFPQGNHSCPHCSRLGPSSQSPSSKVIETFPGCSAAPCLITYSGKLRACLFYLKMSLPYWWVCKTFENFKLFLLMMDGYNLMATVLLHCIFFDQTKNIIYYSFRLQVLILNASSSSR